MSEPSGPKKPPIYENHMQEQMNKEFSFAPVSSPPFLPSSSPCPPGRDKDIEMEESTEQLPIKRGHSQSSLGNKNQNRKKAKSRSIIGRILPSTSSRQHLQKALESLNQAYIGLNEGETKEQINKLKNYTQCVILGENPFLQEKEKQEKEVLKGLVEEVKALRKEVAPTKETYAERLKQGLSSSSSSSSSLSSLLLPSAPISSTSSSHSPSTSTRGKKKQLQERRLVLVTDQKDQPLDIFSIRNQVNQLFASKLQIKKPVIATIARTREKQNILLTTTEEYDAEFLVKHKEIWSNCFSFKREQKLEPWAQVVAHGVPISPFLGEGGSKLLKEEIETFNPIKIQGLPRWISSREKRYDPQTRFGSIVFAIENEEKRQEILKQKEILIAGVAAKVVKYLKISPTTQCTNCQKFGHIGDRCSTRACQFCAAAHLSKDHSCSTCNTIGRPCEHTTPLCINCKEKHFANSKDCESLKAAKLVCQ